MAEEIKNIKTMLGSDTVDPFTPVDVIVERIRWTFGPNFKQSFFDNGTATQIDNASGDLAVTTSADEDAPAGTLS